MASHIIKVCSMVSTNGYFYVDINEDSSGICHFKRSLALPPYAQSAIYRNLWVFPVFYYLTVARASRRLGKGVVHRHFQYCPMSIVQRPIRRNDAHVVAYQSLLCRILKIRQHSSFSRQNY